jgi:hypothetical protein
VKRVKTKQESALALTPYQDTGRMRLRGSHDEWFAVEFLIHYDKNQIRSFEYVRREDGGDIPDGDYEVLEGLDERRRRWKKYDGMWQIKFRHSSNR